MAQKYDYIFYLIVDDEFLADKEMVMVDCRSYRASAKIHFSSAIQRHVIKRNEEAVCWIEILNVFYPEESIQVGDPVLIKDAHNTIVRAYGKVLPYHETPSERD